jgi:TatD DNase family protein
VRWTDNHCHLDPDTAADTVAEARAAGVGRLVNVGTDVSDSTRAVDVARAHDGVWATAGVHPHEAKHGIDGLEALLADARADDGVVVAVGECGLDYHYDHSPRAEQREVFAAQVALAHAHDLPLVIHSREAWDDTFAVLDAEGVPPRTVFHCFSGGPDEARRALDAGAHLSFSGIVTFKTADDLRDAAALCPLDRLLVETDSPFLAPVPHRGQPNRPAWVAVVGFAIAAVKSIAPEDVSNVTWETTAAFYRLD